MVAPRRVAMDLRGVSTGPFGWRVIGLHQEVQSQPWKDVRGLYVHEHAVCLADDAMLSRELNERSLACEDIRVEEYLS